MVVEVIVTGKINNSEGIKRYNNIADNVNTKAKSRTAKAPTKMVDIYKQFK